MKLSEAIDEYCNEKFSFKELFEKMPYTFQGDEYNKVKDRMKHLRKDFISIKQKSEEGIKVVEKLIKVTNSDQYGQFNEAKDLKKIDKINKFLAKQDAYSILDVYITNTVSSDIQMVNKLTDNEEENMKKTLKISLVIYKTLINAIENLTPVLEETLEKL